MTIVNAKDDSFYLLPIFKDKGVIIVTDTAVPNDLKLLFLKAQELIKEHKQFSNTRTRHINVVFLGSESVTIKIPESVFAGQANYIFYPVEKLYQLNELARLAALVEELVHHFWDTDDEIETSRIVCEILDELDYDRETGALSNRK